MDLNKATIEELKQLRGVGDVMAKRIITGRPYRKVEDLLKINGIGTKTLKKIQPYVKGEDKYEAFFSAETVRIVSEDGMRILVESHSEDA